MFDALHPQTILAYGMNGRTLAISHGAPLHFDDGGELGNIQNGWSWYAGV